MPDPLDHIDQLEQQLEQWKTRSRRWENRCKQNDDTIANARRQARRHKNEAHKWRLLYQDLLTQVAQKLDRLESQRGNDQ